MKYKIFQRNEKSLDRANRDTPRDIKRVREEKPPFSRYIDNWKEMHQNQGTGTFFDFGSVGIFAARLGEYLFKRHVRKKRKEI